MTLVFLGSELEQWDSC